MAFAEERDVALDDSYSGADRLKPSSRLESHAINRPKDLLDVQEGDPPTPTITPPNR